MGEERFGEGSFKLVQNPFRDDQLVGALTPEAQALSGNTLGIHKAENPQGQDVCVQDGLDHARGGVGRPSRLRFSARTCAIAFVTSRSISSGATSLNASPMRSIAAKSRSRSASSRANSFRSSGEIRAATGIPLFSTTMRASRRKTRLRSLPQVCLASDDFIV